MRGSEKLPLLAALFTGIQVGAALVASKYVIDQTTPATLAMLRYAIGFLCLLPVVLALPKIKFAVKDLLPISLLGALQFGALIALLNYSLQYLPSAHVALIFASFPLQTLLLAFLLGRETITSAKCIAVLLTIAGIAITLSDSLYLSQNTPIHWLAVLAATTSAFIGAVCSILYRPFLEKYPAQNVSALAMLASVLVLFIYSGVEGSLADLPAITATGWLIILFIGISSGIGYFCWLWALKHLPPTRVTMCLSLSPIASATFGALLLAEPLTLPLMSGIFLVVLGLIIGFRK
ncbi:MAG: DMT family transporter [Sneathiella sp.]